jgi:Mg-chelatase subunit ChlI
MTTFPLSAMVGQQNMRLALILNAIDPSIGGVLICGRRGTGKSTAVRALTNLLPPITGVADCPYSCNPTAPQWMCNDCQVRFERGETFPIAQLPVHLVTLPLNASEDRVAGSFDLATALASGTSYFAPGLLAAANRGFLYSDESNLLNDRIVDLLLDAASLGVNRVLHVCTLENRMQEDCVLQTCPAEIGFLQICFTQVCSDQVGIGQVRPPQVGSLLNTLTFVNVDGYT